MIGIESARGSRWVRTSLLLGLAVILRAEAVAQVAPAAVLLAPVAIASGAVGNPAPGTQVVWSQTVSIPGAATMQLRFANVSLPDPADAIVVTGALDDQTQELHADTLAQWGSRSAWFNGDVVTVSLSIASGSVGSATIVDALAVAGTPIPAVGTDNQCGPTDDRTLSSSAAVFRLILTDGTSVGGCTGTVVNNSNVCISAGHCFAASSPLTGVAQFNVPMSSGTGVINAPPIQHQYPVDMSTLQSENAGVGLDWAAFRLHPNNLGQTAFSQQGARNAVATTILPGTTLRVTGYGTDTTPNATFNQVQQTATGPFVGFLANVMTYQVDTEPGDSGAPIIREATGDVIGIHTTGGCNTPGAVNFGTAMSYAAITTAIASLTGCATTNLQNNFPAQFFCWTQLFVAPTNASRWNVVAVGNLPGADWDVQVNGVFSSFNGNFADFVISNGHLGSGTAPVIGSAGHTSGANGAVLEFQEAVPIFLGLPTTVTWNPAGVVELFEFNVTIPGTYNIFTHGDASLFWDLYDPGSGSEWRPRGASVYGQVGAAPALGVSLSAGWHCLVVVRDPGPGPVTVSDLTVAVYRASNQLNVNLVAGVPAGSDQASLSSTSRFSLTPTAGVWNAVSAASAASDWSLSLGPVTSHFPQPYSDFVLANGHLGALSPTDGHVDRATGSTSRVLEHVVASALTPGNVVETSLPAGHVMALWEFNVPATGNYTLSVQGNPGLLWDIYGPGTDASWRPRGAIFYGTVGSSPMTGVSLSPGVWALAIIRDGGVSTNALPYTIDICPSAAPVDFPQTGGLVSFSGPCIPFIMHPTPASGAKWNVVAVGSTASNWDLSIGAALAHTGTGTDTEYAIMNGHNGLPSVWEGMFSRLTGGASAVGQHVNAPTLAVGATLSTSLPAGAIVAMHEFNVTAAGNYDVALPGGAGLTWDLYAPGTTSDWLGRGGSTNVTFGAVGGAPQVVALGVGWHAIVVVKDGGPSASSIPYSVSVCASATTLAFGSGGGVQSTTNATCQPFTITPTSNAWNVVAVGGGGNWDMSLGTTQSASPTNNTDFVIANGHNGAIAPTSGVVTKASGAAFGTVQAAPATPLTIGIPHVSTLPSGSLIALREFFIASSGVYRVTTAGDPSLIWDIYTPGSGSSWIPRGAPFFGTLGSATQTPTLGVGWHAITVTKDTGPATAPMAFSLTICPNSTPLNFPAGSGSGNVTTNCAPFTVTPTANRWVVAGVGGSTSDWNIGAGLAYSQRANPDVDFVVANGHNGAVAPTEGLAVRASGATAARVQVATAAAPATVPATIPTTVDVVGIVEFTIPTAGVYGIFVSGAPIHTGFVFAPGTTSGWLARTQSAASFVANASWHSLTFAAGTYALVIVPDQESTASPFSVNVSIAPENPTPTVTTLTPNSAPVGSPNLAITLSGTGFLSSSIVAWNSTPLFAPTSVTSTSLTATIPASYLAAVGTASVSVFNSGPGGGESNLLTFTVANPAPVLASITPSTTTTCPALTTLGLTGSAFVAGSVVSIDNVAVATTFNGPTSLTASVPPAVASSVGPHQITVQSPGPGGGTSAPRTLTIEPLKVLSASPSSMAALGPASPPITILVTVNANPNTVGTNMTVYAGGAALATSPVANSNFLQAVLGPTVVQAQMPGALAIAVRGCGNQSSNAVPLRVGAGGSANNQGLVGHHPLADPLVPGAPFDLVIEGGVVGQPFVLDIDPGNPPPQTGWPNATANMVYALGSPAEQVILDGLGFVGPPMPFAVFSPGGSTAPGGVFVLPSIVAPSPAAGVTFTMQCFFLDPASPAGFRLGWPRYLMGI